jgi:hypothetical protein
MKGNIWGIILDHYKTFYNFRTKRISIIDYVIHLVIPFFCAFFLYKILNVSFTASLISLLITLLSIFAALLLNLLILVYTIKQKENDETPRNMLMKEVSSNISYGIIISIILLVLLIIIAFILEKQVCPSNLNIDILNLLTWFFLAQFFLVILMILKRVYIILMSK